MGVPQYYRSFYSVVVANFNFTSALILLVKRCWALCQQTPPSYPHYTCLLSSLNKLVTNASYSHFVKQGGAGG